MLSILTETQKAVVETITMRLHPTQALHYLKEAGHEMSRAKYFRHKKKINEMKFERMKYIAEHFQDQHLERVDKCEIIERLMWENYYAEKNPSYRVKILESIIEMQPYLSSYYDATRYVLMQSIRSDADLKDPPDTYVSVNLRDFREKEILQDKAAGKLFDPYKKDAEPEPKPRPTTYPTIPDPNNPGRWLTDPAWIEENFKKMHENSNLNDKKKGINLLEQEINSESESASWD